MLRQRTQPMLSASKRAGSLQLAVTQKSLRPCEWRVASDGNRRVVYIYFLLNKSESLHIMMIGAMMYYLDHQGNVVETGLCSITFAHLGGVKLAVSAHGSFHCCNSHSRSPSHLHHRHSEILLVFLPQPGQGLCSLAATDTVRTGVGGVSVWLAGFWLWLRTLTSPKNDPGQATLAPIAFPVSPGSFTLVSPATLRRPRRSNTCSLPPRTTARANLQQLPFRPFFLQLHSRSHCRISIPSSSSLAKSSTHIHHGRDCKGV